jgi:hypothetical protein
MKQTGRRTALILVILLSSVLVPMLACAGESFEYLGAGELKKMIDLKDPGLVVIDSRPVSQYEEAHIKGALNMPLADIERDETLPNVTKNAMVVFYCSANT